MVSSSSTKSCIQQEPTSSGMNFISGSSCYIRNQSSSYKSIRPYLYEAYIINRVKLRIFIKGEHIVYLSVLHPQNLTCHSYNSPIPMETNFLVFSCFKKLQVQLFTSKPKLKRIYQYYQFIMKHYQLRSLVLTVLND